MQSVSVNIAAMFIGVCVCVWPDPNGKTMAHQLLFDYSCRGSGTMSVITHTHTLHMRKNPHLQLWVDK